ncbi:hypothetical protein D9M70_482120 [compost metagenome]
MSLEKRNGAVAAVLFHIARIPDAKRCLVEQGSQYRKNCRRVVNRPIHLFADSSPHPRKRLGKVGKLVVLGAASQFLPGIVIAILLPAARIIAGRLKVTVLVHADPDPVVGWRQSKRFDACNDAGVLQRRAVRASITKAVRRARPAVARFLV